MYGKIKGFLVKPKFTLHFDEDIIKILKNYGLYG